MIPQEETNWYQNSHDLFVDHVDHERNGDAYKNPGWIWTLRG